LDRYTTFHETHIVPVAKTKPVKRNLFSFIGKKVAPKEDEQRSESKQRLSRAGFYTETAFYTYWGIKIFFVIALPLCVILFWGTQSRSLINSAMPLLFALGLGLFAPDIYLYFAGKSREKKIFHALPDALDLLVVCLEAGLGLDSSLQKVSDEFHVSSPVLSNELTLTCNAIRLGQSRSEALHDLGERTGSLDLKALVAVLNQADRFGTSMAQALRVHADDMRTRRKQRAEELAAKTTVKLIFPLVLFIFPAIFVVLGGPAIIRIINTLGKHV
jgi:tight adherence protein C